ncbi:hypothetical protein D5018_09300 [Parashewanella curva]|uniref:Uncharacterized protein n=1 Tax=Parashewanella curva TaxID=2338552 RepID=A0A3L8PXD4_9GAMM|nr:hypothetical protein [Parashewanella curva]RLV59990.1 hypothetical protein D5018_09300 [Parashewanella curva]
MAQALYNICCDFLRLTSADKRLAVSDSEAKQHLFFAGSTQKKYDATQIAPFSPFAQFSGTDTKSPVISQQPTQDDKLPRGLHAYSLALSNYQRHTFFGDQDLCVCTYGTSIGCPIWGGLVTTVGMIFYPTEICGLSGVAVGGIAWAGGVVGGIVLAVGISVTAEIVMRVKMNKDQTLEDLVKALNQLDQQGFPTVLRDSASNYSLRDPVFIKGRKQPISARMLYECLKKGEYELGDIKLTPENVLLPENYSKIQRKIAEVLNSCFKQKDTVDFLIQNQKNGNYSLEIEQAKRQLSQLVVAYSALLSF